MAHGLLEQRRESEVRVIEREGQGWLQPWRMLSHGHCHERAWVVVAERRFTDIDHDWILELIASGGSAHRRSN